MTKARGRYCFFDVGVREFSVDSGRIVEAKVIEDGKESTLWRAALSKVKKS